MLNMDTAESAFRNMLYPGESFTGIIYCVFKPTGFFAGTSFNRINPGFAAVTSDRRLLTIQTSSAGYFLGSSSTAAYDINSAVKLKVRKNIFGQYVFDCIFPVNGKNLKVKFQAARKVLGSEYSMQEENLEEILSVVKRYEI